MTEKRLYELQRNKAPENIRPFAGRAIWLHFLCFVFTALLSAAMIPHTALALEADALTNMMQVIYNDQNGLPAAEANTVLQTSDGYIWIGSYGGLVRYDGTEFINYSTVPGGLTTFGIRALFEDSRGRLWIGTNDKGVFKYENGGFTACRLPEDGRFCSVRCFAEDSSGAVYVGTSTGLAMVEADAALVPAGPGDERLEGQTVYSLSFDGSNVLWGTAGAGFAFAVKDGSLACWLEPGDLNENENYCVLADGDVIYIGTGGNALLRLTRADDSYSAGSFLTETYRMGSVSTVNALCLTDDGQLWAGCNTGSGWFDNGMVFHELEGMKQNTFLSCIMQDYEGNLWMASTRGGVFQLRRSKFLNANQSAGLEGKSVNAVVRLNGLLYAASDYGLYIADADWKPVNNALTADLEGLRIRHLCADSTGKLWISTYSDAALLCYTPSTGACISVTERDGLLSNKVRLAVELENGDMAVGTTAGINILRDGKVTESYGQAQGLENPVVLCLLEASDGTLFAGSDGMGIYAVKDGAVRNIGKQEGLETGSVLRMREDLKAGGIWISSGSGLYFMNREGEVREITDFNYGVGSVFDIQVMEDDIWLMKSSGLIIVPREALLGGQEMTAVQYGRESGLTANLTANSWNLYEDGVLYLSSVSGVFLLDNGNIPKIGIPPKIVVDEVTVQQSGGKTTVFHRPGSLTLPNDTKRVTVSFACLTFSGAPGTVAYYLEGFDEQPTLLPAGQSHTVSYTNLRGGGYVFHLSAQNADNVPTEAETVLPVVKNHRFYELPPVWLGMALLLAALVLLGAKLVLDLKTRKLKHRQQEYRAITDQALKTIANTIDAKDKYTKGHSIRVAGYSRELARRLGLSGEEQERIFYIGLLHDIGKIGIPDAILNKPGKLTDEEFETMRSHTQIGGHILEDFTALPQIADGALRHHENYDGSGYPDHKKGDEIPLVARIIRAADSYDAMATVRSYRGSLDKEYILSEFQKFSGIQFEPRIAQLMSEMIAEGFEPETAEL